MRPFERSLSKCSENHDCTCIHEIQVMAAERVPEPLINRRGVGLLLSLYIHAFRLYIIITLYMYNFVELVLLIKIIIIVFYCCV